MEQNIELKVTSKVNVDDLIKMSDFDVNQYRDERGYNLLMCAAETGNIFAVNNLIDRGENVNFEVDGESAASLAFTQGHYEVVLQLIKSNSKFPSNFRSDKCSDELKIFAKLSHDLHESVMNNSRDNNFEDLKSNFKVHFDSYKNVRHFYNFKNISLLKTSLLSKEFEIYEFLMTQNIFLAPHEHMDEIIPRLRHNERKRLSEINLKLSPELFTEDLMVLMRNCKLGPDTPEERHNEFICFIRNAFESLLKNPLTGIILKIVAAKRDFTIVFDFNRDSVTFLDPRAEPYMNGLFYFSGKIYIAAKDMLDSRYSHNVIGVIVHELCHFAMFLVYNNSANPYKKGKEKIFKEIFDECNKNKESEEIIESVFEDYPDEAMHAELIVRVPQLIAIYVIGNEILEQKRKTFYKLFEFYEQVCVPQMKNELPKIEMKNNPFKRAEIKHRRRILILSLFLLLSIVAGVIVGFLIYDPTITWNDLTPSQKLKVRNSHIKVFNTILKFDELFGNDSPVYDVISSEHLKSALNNEHEVNLMLSKDIEMVYDKFIFLNWSNMTQSLREKILRSNVNFQDQIVTFEDILKNSSALYLLTSHELRSLLEENAIKISSGTENISNVYVERFFINEKANPSPEFYINVNKTNLRANAKNPNVLNTEKILDYLKAHKVFLLSSVAGDGKSTTMRYLAKELKKKFPQKWIKYVDLKRYIKSYRNYENLTQFLGKRLQNLNKFEYEIFIQAFESNNTIFLWDGIDEISPVHERFMLSLTMSIKRKSANWQFIATRPQHSENFKSNLQISSFKFLPLGLSEVEDLVRKISVVNCKQCVDLLNDASEADENIDLTLYNLTYQKVDKAMKTLRHISSLGDHEDLVSNPLLIQIVAELAALNKFQLYENITLYSLYDTFITEKFKLIHDKGNIVTSVTDKVLKGRHAILKIHQAYAIQIIYRFFKIQERFSELKVLNLAHESKDEEISRFGIIQLFYDSQEFLHRTFAEFFVAQFFVDSFEKHDKKLNGKEVETEMLLLALFQTLYNMGGVRRFLFDYINSQKLKDLHPIFQFYHHENFITKHLTPYAGGNENKEAMKFINYFRIRKYIEKNTKLQINYKFTNVNYIFFPYDNLIEHWDKYLKVLGEEMFVDFLNCRDSGNLTVFSGVSNDVHTVRANRVLNSVQEKISKSLQNKNIKEIYWHQNPLLYFAKSEGINLTLAWNFVEQHFTKSEQRNLLLMRDNNCYNVLHYSTMITRIDSFKFLKDIYKVLFTVSELKEICYQFCSYEPFLHESMCHGKYNIHEYLAPFLKEIFDDDRKKMRLLFRHANFNFYFFRYKRFVNRYRHPDDKTLETVKSLIRWTFTENEEKEFQEFFRIVSLEVIPVKLKFLMNLYMNEIFEYSNVILNDKVVFESVQSIVENWEQITENFNKREIEVLIKGNSIDNVTILQSFIQERGKNESVTEKFLNVLKENLKAEELEEIIFKSLTSITRTAVVYFNENSLKFFYKFLRESLDSSKIVKILMHSESAIFYSAWNADKNCFIFIKEIYLMHFSTDEILEIFFNVNNFALILSSFRQEVVENNTKTLEVYVEFMKIIFTDEKIELRKILSQKFYEGLTIFKARDKELKTKNYEMLLELLKYTFEGNQEEFESFFNKLTREGNINYGGRLLLDLENYDKSI